MLTGLIDSVGTLAWLMATNGHDIELQQQNGIFFKAAIRALDSSLSIQANFKQAKYPMPIIKANAVVLCDSSLCVLALCI